MNLARAHWKGHMWLSRRSRGSDTTNLRRPSPLKEVMEVREDADGVGSEEDDVDAKGKFFVAINVRSRHRKLHIWGKCGTKPGQNFAAYEPHDSPQGSSV